MLIFILKNYSLLKELIIKFNKIFFLLINTKKIKKLSKNHLYHQ